MRTETNYGYRVFQLSPSRSSDGQLCLPVRSRPWDGDSASHAQLGRSDSPCRNAASAAARAPAACGWARHRAGGRGCRSRCLAPGSRSSPISGGSANAHAATEVLGGCTASRNRRGQASSANEPASAASTISTSTPTCFAHCSNLSPVVPRARSAAAPSSGHGASTSSSNRSVSRHRHRSRSGRHAVDGCRFVGLMREAPGR